MSADLPPLTPTETPPNTPKKIINKKLLVIAVLTVLAAKGYVVYTNFTQKSPELRFALEVYKNPALQQEMAAAGNQALTALTTEEGCPQLVVAPLLYLAKDSNLSEEEVARKLNDRLEDQTTMALIEALQRNPLVVQEAEKVSANLAKFAQIVIAAAGNKLEDEQPQLSQVHARDGLLEAKRLPLSAFKAAELHACVLDARAVSISKELFFSMSDAYTAMRKTAYSAAPGESDLFARMPATDMPKLAAGVQRWQSAGDFVLLAELPVTESALCDKLNTKMAEPLPAWAMPEGAPAVSSAMRWSCTQHADKIVVRHDGALQSLVPAK